MKKIVIASLVMAAASVTFAQSKMGDMKGMDMAKKPAAGAQTAHEANGTHHGPNAQGATPCSSSSFLFSKNNC